MRNVKSPVRRDASAALRDLLQRPELRPLIGATELLVGPDHALPFLVPAPGRLVVTQSMLAGAAAATHLRHGLELAWLLTIVPDAPPLCGLLAARCAELFQALEPAARRYEPPPLSLAGDLPPPTVLARRWGALSAHQLVSPGDIGTATIASIAAAWQLAAPTEQLLTTGGDTRLRLDPETGLNRYGCSTRPRPWAVTFGSCTASSISERGYGAAEACRRRLLHAALIPGRDGGPAAESELIRAGILDHYGAAELADVVLSPSGTDASLLLAAIVQAEQPSRALTTILMGRGETGSGVPRAVAGRHFASEAAFGDAVAAGEVVAGYGPGLDVSAVPLRNPAGFLRPMREIDAAVSRAVEAATGNGRALLHLIDTSKTGVLAPSLRQAEALKRTHAPALELAIDACQARLAPQQLRHYLVQGSAVLLTGSKFFTGPAFSGAVVLPRGRLAAVRDALPTGLRDYSAGLDWVSPPPSTAPGGNIGLILRWAAALAEMKAFATVPAARKMAILDRFEAEVTERLAVNPSLVPMTSPAPVRSSGDQWSARQTIFTFGLRDPAAPDRLLDMATLGRIHRWLYTDLGDLRAGAVARRSCHVGQPVALGRRAGRAIGALRIAAGARLVSGEPSHAGLEDEARLDREISDLGGVIAKLDLILGALDALSHADASR